MPKINIGSLDETLSNYVGYDHQTMATPEFTEVMGASIGLVIDEELSISGMLNREGWSEREMRVKELIQSGEVGDTDKYWSDGGLYRKFNYNQFAIDANRPDIKTDEQLNKERNETLASRRRYAQDILNRGAGSTQFLGAMTAYMLDPVNILTVGIAAPATTAKALTTVGRAMQATKNAAIIGGGTEIGIQAFVYQHKQTIDSPYSARDALGNIAMAATGAGVLGGVTEGISGYFKSAINKAKELPQTEEIKTAIDYLQRQDETLRGAPKVDADAVREEMLTRLQQQVSNEIAQASPTAAAKVGKLVDELAMINSGKLPERFEKEFAQELHSKQVESDVEYLQEMDNRATQYAGPSKTPDIYQRPLQAANDATPPPPPATASQRERDVLRAQGLEQVFDKEMATFANIENKVFEVDGEVINAEDIVKSFDDEIKGLDEVLACAYGGAA